MQCSAVCYGFASIEPALTVATLFTQIYHFDTVRNGYVALALFPPLNTILIASKAGKWSQPSSWRVSYTCLIGRCWHLTLLPSTLGELCSGPVTDLMMQRARRKALVHGDSAPAEVRLQGIWSGAVTVPAGLLMCVNILDVMAYRICSLTDQNVCTAVSYQRFDSGRMRIDRILLTDGFTIHFATTFIAPCIGMGG